MRPLFADPKIDLVFKRIFGQKAHKRLLIELLNDLLGLPEERRIVDLLHLPQEQVPPRYEGKSAIVDVQCTDAAGTHYIVEMQVLNVEGFEKRLVFNASRSFTGQIVRGEDYPQLNDVVMVALCDFHLWHREERLPGATVVPMVSRWCLTEELTGARRFRQLRFVVMELPKYAAGEHPVSTLDRWAYFFRRAADLRQIPEELSQGPFREALEVARASSFTEEEWEAYVRAGIAEQDARGALELATRLGREEGEARGEARGELKGAILTLCEVLDIELTAERRASLQGLDLAALRALRDHLRHQRACPPP